ncbi:hypothetical protein [Curtobacterium flaccumfaciens]|uniref:hypothetical protein n=1 Tax=Curtobacterium flaccumfaciens TaxID=2035 RepID=UPI003995FFD2
MTINVARVDEAARFARVWKMAGLDSDGDRLRKLVSDLRLSAKVSGDGRSVDDLEEVARYLGHHTSGGTAERLLEKLADRLRAA